MTLNYFAILICGILSMVVGFIWYGPLFGKLWLEVSGLSALDEKAKKAMMTGAWKLYITQFFVSLFQLYVLALYIKGWEEGDPYFNSFWIWAGFVMPSLFAAIFWTAESKKNQFMRIALQGGYQLVMFMIFALILGRWG